MTSAGGRQSGVAATWRGSGAVSVLPGKSYRRRVRHTFIMSKFTIPWTRMSLHLYSYLFFQASSSSSSSLHPSSSSLHPSSLLPPSLIPPPHPSSLGPPSSSHPHWQAASTARFIHSRGPPSVLWSGPGRDPRKSRHGTVHDAALELRRHLGELGVAVVRDVTPVAARARARARAPAPALPALRRPAG